MYGLSDWTGVLIGFVIRTLFLVLFLLTLRGLLKQIRLQNRVFNPDLVWLNLVPLFDYAWIFVTLVKVRDSVRAEYRARGWAHRPDALFRVGLTSAILYLVAGLAELMPVLAGSSRGSWPFVWVVTGLLGLGCLVLWVIYWMGIARLKRTLEQEAFIPVQERQTGCPSCGAHPMPDDEFCRSCGLPVEMPEEQPTETMEQMDDSAGTEETGKS